MDKLQAYQRLTPLTNRLGITWEEYAINHIILKGCTPKDGCSLARESEPVDLDDAVKVLEFLLGAGLIAEPNQSSIVQLEQRIMALEESVHKLNDAVALSSPEVPNQETALQQKIAELNCHVAAIGNKLFVDKDGRISYRRIRRRVAQGDSEQFIFTITDVCKPNRQHCRTMWYFWPHEINQLELFIQHDESIFKKYCAD